MSTDERKSEPDTERLHTYSIRVLGCKVNQHEARQIETLLEAAGLIPAGPGTAPDLAFVHGCAVTQAALGKTLRQARALDRKARVLLVTGCGGAALRTEADRPEDAVIVPSGPGWIPALCDALDRLPLPRPIPSELRTPDGPVLKRFLGHTRAFLKIQDGCDLGCAYCLVPHVRGAPRDRPLDVIRKEAENLAREGHVELVVTGVCVGLFGRTGGALLPQALRTVTAVPHVKRVRLSSLHPAELTEDLLQVWAEYPEMAPHIHLPLQSGSDSVLARMRRGYTKDEFRQAADRARDSIPGLSLSTDIIVGFPGETDEDFEQTLDLCRELGFMRMHVFPFSPRPGTAAARMTPRLDAKTVQARARRARALGEILARDAYQSALGRPADVLCEVRDHARGLWRGYSEHYIPLRFPGPPDWAGRIVRVTADLLSPRSRV